MAVNAKGAFLLCRSVIPVLPKPGGVIVFTGSFTGEIRVAERAACSASKGALRLFTQSLALELARDGIRVNGVAPAFVESAMGRQTLEITAASERIAGRPVERTSRSAPAHWETAMALLTPPADPYTPATRTARIFERD